MATVPSTENIINHNKNINFTNEAINLLKTIEEKVIFAYEDYIVEDLDKYQTAHDWHLYIITLKDGIETPRFFYRELSQTRDVNQKCIKTTEMPSFKETDVEEQHLEFIDNIKAFF
jgi:hypothetical protein